MPFYQGENRESERYREQPKATQLSRRGMRFKFKSSACAPFSRQLLSRFRLANGARAGGSLKMRLDSLCERLSLTWMLQTYAHVSSALYRLCSWWNKILLLTYMPLSVQNLFKKSKWGVSKEIFTSIPIPAAPHILRSVSVTTASSLGRLPDGSSL